MKAKVKRTAAAPSERAGIPTLETLLGSILDRLPPDALKSIAGMPPLDEGEREAFEGQVVELAQALAADRVCGVDHTPNAATRRAIRDLEEGRDVTRYDNLADAFADLGI